MCDWMWRCPFSEWIHAGFVCSLLRNQIDSMCSLDPDGFPPFTGREKAHVTQFSALGAYWFNLLFFSPGHLCFWHSKSLTCVGVHSSLPEYTCVCLSIDSHRYPEDKPFDSFVPAAAGAGGMWYSVAPTPESCCTPHLCQTLQGHTDGLMSHNRHYTLNVITKLKEWVTHSHVHVTFNLLNLRLFFFFFFIVTIICKTKHISPKLPLS